MNKFKSLLLASALTLVCAPAFANGIFEGLPLVGGGTYCVSTINGTCQQYAPAGPSAITGNEVAPANVGPLGTNVPSGADWALFSITQLGNGAAVDLTTVGTSQTIPANTPFYYLDGAQGSALTVTMPAAPIDGQIQRVICEAATVGVLTVAANTGQTLKNNPNAACVAGVSYSWRYTASNTTWYRF